MAKAVHLIYEFPGDLLANWEARPMGNDTYMVVRPNGTTREMRLGETVQVHEKGSRVPGMGIVNRSETGVLMIGNKSVIIGNGIKHGFQARATGASSTYVLRSDKGHTIGRVAVGDNIDGQAVSLVDKHLLKVGESIYPIVPKLREITLLVLQSPYEDGYLSYINVVEKGNKLNRKDSPMGAFIPPQNAGEPAKYVEVYGGRSVVTALFWADPEGKKVNYQFRDGDTALLEFELEGKVQDARKTAIECGIEPEDLAEYVDANTQLQDVKKLWENESMMLVQGASYFRPHDVRRTFEEFGMSI